MTLIENMPWVQSPDWATHDRHLMLYEKSSFKRKALPWDGTIGIHTLLGPRRIGKSTLFKLWVRNLLEKKTTSPREIFFLDAERFESWQELLAVLEPVTAKYFFIDEVTVVRDWPRALKILADSGKFDSTTVWLTGSNSFDLKTMGERLPGRRGKGHALRDIEILPLTFSEFFEATQERFQGNKNLIFDKFCQWGGYPMAVSECLERDEPSHDLLIELVDVSLGATSKRHRSPKLTMALAEKLWAQLGSRSSFNALAKAIDAGSHPILRQYIEILEGCYALLTVERLNPKTQRGVFRKEKKFYFFDSLVMGALVSFSESGMVKPSWFTQQWADPVKQGPWIESIVASEFRKRHQEFFYDERHGCEVDFVWKDSSQTWSALEVKRTVPSKLETRALRDFKQAEVWVLQDKDQYPERFEIKNLIEQLLLLPAPSPQLHGSLR